MHAGGPLVEDPLQHNRLLACGTIIKAQGGQLPCNKVYHVCCPVPDTSPRYSQMGVLKDMLSVDEREALMCCIINILTAFRYKKLNQSKRRKKSVAIPVLGSFHGNKKKLENCMWHMATLLREQLKSPSSKLRQITLVVRGMDNFNLFQRLLEHVFPASKFQAFRLHVDNCVQINKCSVSLVTGDLLKMKVGYGYYGY
jgi:hypothetical protein